MSKIEASDAVLSILVSFRLVNRALNDALLSVRRKLKKSEIESSRTIVTQCHDCTCHIDNFQTAISLKMCNPFYYFTLRLLIKVLSDSSLRLQAEI